MHYFVGDLGHLFVITSLITALLAAFSYLKATLSTDLAQREGWIWNGKTAFLVHAISVL